MMPKLTLFVSFMNDPEYWGAKEFRCIAKTPERVAVVRVAVGQETLVSGNLDEMQIVNDISVEASRHAQEVLAEIGEGVTIAPDPTAGMGAYKLNAPRWLR